MTLIKELLDSPFTIDDFVTVLDEVDEFFVPPLKARLINKSTVSSFRDYAQKVINHGHVLLQYNADEIEGFAVFYANDEQFYKAYIPLVAVRGNYRSRGVGKNLVGKSIQLIEEAKMKSIVIKTWKNNSHAVALYTSLGFQVVQIEVNDIVLEYAFDK